MKQKDFKDLSKTFPEDIEITFSDDKLKEEISFKVKSYLSAEQKQEFISLVTDAFLTSNNNKYLLRDIYHVYCTIKYFSDIPLPQIEVKNDDGESKKYDNVQQIYEVAINSGLYSMIYDEIKDQIDELSNYIDLEIGQKEKENGSINKVIEGLKDSLISGLEEATQAMNGFDPEKLEFVKNMFKSGLN